MVSNLREVGFGLFLFGLFFPESDAFDVIGLRE